MLNWWMSERGRSVVGRLVAVAAFGIAAAHVSLHTLFLDKYKGVVQMYRNGQAVILSDAVLNRANGVLQECGLSESEAKTFKFFTVVGLDTFHAGSTKLREGPCVGLPHTFTYGRVEDVEKELLLVRGEKFNFESSIGQELLNSIILSERAQKFAIAREIHACTTQYVYLQALFGAASLYLVYCMASFINTRFNFLKLPRVARFVMYGLTGSIGMVNYVMLKDGLAVYNDRAADIATCSMGKVYILGGLEYYEKLLVRNRALRDALGATGKAQYTFYGNEEVFIRTKRLPITAHLDVVKDAFKEVEKQNQFTLEQQRASKESLA